MKHFFSILFIAFALSITASAQEIIDLQVNGVGIGATDTEVILKLGKPTSRKKGRMNECVGGEPLTLRYPGLVLELSEDMDDKFTVLTVTVTSPKWSVSGISIGASVNQVRKKFGDSKLTKEKGLEYLNYSISDGYANFVFRKKTLVEIYWELNLC